MRGKLVGGEPAWEEDTCKHFRKKPDKAKKQNSSKKQKKKKRRRAR